MNQFAFAKQMIDLNRTAFRNAFDAACLFREHTGKVFNAFVEQASWVPDEGKKALAEMTEAVTKGCTEFRKVVDENFDKMEACLGEAERPE